VAREDQRLREFLARFAVFTSPNDERAIVYIADSIRASGYQLAGRVASHDYVGVWLSCFQEQLNSPAKPLTAFLRRWQEFAHIVDQFNRNYVQRIQNQLADESLQSHYVDQLEEFREEFNDFVRDLESWSGVVGAYLRPRNLWRPTPTSFFERVKTFLRAKPAGSTSR
jgi:hypothetical protein